jgi:hypothetical protein
LYKDLIFSTCESVNAVPYVDSSFKGNSLVDSHVAYVFKPNSTASSFVNAVRKMGLLVVFNDKTVSFDGQIYEPGYLWVLKKTGTWEKLHQLANAAQIKLTGVTSFRSEQGADLGSVHFKQVNSSRIAVIVDGSFDVGQQGEIAFYLTNQMLLNPVFIPFNQLFRANLSSYSHLIFPHAKSVDLTKSQQILLDDFVRKGGQVILLEKSGNLISDKELALKEKDLSDSSTVQVAYEDMERHEISKTLSGNLLEVQLDKTHPLGFRIGQNNMLVINQAESLMHPHARWKSILKTNEKPLYYGFMGNLVKPKIANSLMLGTYSLGAGNYIWFGFNPLFRAIPNQSMVLFENSILYHGN